ncbi:MAG TPA: EAL domain-containing protein, partial [Bryobacteraceae bacterium]|nr:EAL domain-containing protein [Bryobacteraceae bacterium]
EWFDAALAEDRFSTWFQPIVDTNGHRLVGHECLIRLQAERLYSGAEIVGAAGIRGEIHAFDSHARRLAIRSAARQSRQGVYFINFMPASIYNPDRCMKSAADAVGAAGMNRENIVFEVPESDLASDPAHLRRICDYFRREGFGFALGGVGCGSGNGADTLQNVCDLQPNYIKLDKALVRNVEQPVHAAAIRQLVELSDRFGVGVIAEGVERRHTMENLWLLGVECMQGFLFGRPSARIASCGDGRDIASLGRSIQSAGTAAVPVFTTPRGYESALFR